MSEHFQLTMSMHLSPARPGLLCLWLIFKFFLSFFFPALSLCCYVQALCFSEWGLLSSVVPRLLIAVASLAVEHGLQVYSLQQLRRMGSVVVAHGLSCPAACGILLDQGSNSSPALAGRFLTTGPPESPLVIFIEV